MRQYLRFSRKVLRVRENVRSSDRWKLIVSLLRNINWFPVRENFKGKLYRL